MKSFNWSNPYPSHRIPLFARNVVSTSHPLASQAGLRMLLKGGNAVDAAIATAACMTLVEPVSNGLGSDCFAMVWDGRQLHGLNASGVAPAAWNPGYFERKYGVDGQGLARQPLAVDAILAFEVTGVPGRRRHTRCVQAVQLPAVPDHGKTVAAQAVGDRLDQRHAGRRSDRRIHRIAALEQHAQAGLRRQRMGGRDHIARKQRNAVARIRVAPIERFHEE